MMAIFGAVLRIYKGSVGSIAYQDHGRLRAVFIIIIMINIYRQSLPSIYSSLQPTCLAKPIQLFPPFPSAYPRAALK